MSYAAAPPRPGTVNITVSGPSTALAYARALAAKAKGWAGTAVFSIKAGIRTITRVPKAVANVALSALSTKAGYDAAVSVVSKAVRLVGRVASKVVRTVGKGLKKAATVVTGLVHHVAPKIADKADQVIETVAVVADVAVTAVEVALTGASQIVGALVRSPLVVVTTTRAAGLASGALAIHALTKGAAASRIVRAVPAAMTLVVWATSPWKLLGAVAGVMVGAMAFAAFRLGRMPATPPEPAPGWDTFEDDDLPDWDPRDTNAQEDLLGEVLNEAAFADAEPAMTTWDELLANAPQLAASFADVGVLPRPLHNETLAPMAPAGMVAVDLTSVVEAEPAMTLAASPEAEHGPASSQEQVSLDVANLRVAIGIDGSIEVHGIPADLPEDKQRSIAQTAADAAAEQLHRIVRRGRPLKSADRRHVTKAARAAVLAGFDRLVPVAA